MDTPHASMAIISARLFVGMMASMNARHVHPNTVNYRVSDVVKERLVN